MDRKKRTCPCGGAISLHDAASAGKAFPKKIMTTRKTGGHTLLYGAILLLKIFIHIVFCYEHE